MSDMLRGLSNTNAMLVSYARRLTLAVHRRSHHHHCHCLMLAYCARVNALDLAHNLRLIAGEDMSSRSRRLDDDFFFLHVQQPLGHSSQYGLHVKRTTTTGCKSCLRTNLICESSSLLRCGMTIMSEISCPRSDCPAQPSPPQLTLDTSKPVSSSVARAGRHLPFACLSTHYLLEHVLAVNY